MHDILIKFLIDIAKGEQSIKIPYLKGKKERIKELRSLYKHVNTHSISLYMQFIKMINVLSSSKRERLLNFGKSILSLNEF